MEAACNPAASVYRQTEQPHFRFFLKIKTGGRMSDMGVNLPAQSGGFIALAKLIGVCAAPAFFLR
jgi:hypothetical protein